MDFSSECNATGNLSSDNDEEYDLLNSETFGDTQEDYDWDASTKADEENVSSKFELTVNELVLDDEPDDPAIITVHARRIPSIPTNDELTEICGPQSPPAYVSNLGSLLDPSQDIWRGPVGNDQFINLSSSPAAIPTDGFLGASFERNGGYPPMPALQPRSETPPSQLTGSPIAMPTNAMTVEELERQMSSEATPIPSVSHPSSAQYNRPMTPPQQGHQGSPHQGSPYRQPMLAGSPQQRPMYNPLPQQAPHHPGGMPRLQLVQRPMMQQGNAAHMMQHTDPRMHRGMRPVTILQRQAAEQHGDPQMYRMMQGQGTPPRNQMPPYNGYGPRAQRFQQMAGPANVARLPYNNMPLPRPGMMHQRMHMMTPQQQQMYMGRPRDEYAGLLTDREKDWLIKIQMLQLHTDDPYADDYYYTIFNIEKSESANSKLPGDLIVPALAKLESRQYTPMQFEGSLGRLTSSSVHKPRQVLDVGDKNDQLHTAVETKKYRLSLLLAEKAYQLILDIDELKKNIPSVPLEQRSELEANCQKKILKLNQIVEENWSPMLNIRKGRSLILRTLPLIDKHSCKHLLQKLMTGIAAVTKKERTDPVNTKSLKCLEVALAHCDIEALLTLSDLLKPTLKSVLKTGFGCYLVVSMIRQAEMIYAAFVDVAEELTERWNTFVDDFLSCLGALKSPPKLMLVSISVHDHLSRRPNSADSLSKIENWFKRSV